MTFRQFAIGLTATFGVAWLAVIIVPFFLMRTVEPVSFNEVTDGKTGTYFPKRAGRVANGAEVYATNGCYLCHTQVIRPTYAGNDLARPDWAGRSKDEERGDTRRESTAFDYFGEPYAQIGVMRLGPDLSNVGLRVEDYVKESGGDAKGWLMRHLFNPRLDPSRPTSKCPSHRFLFDEKKVVGQMPDSAIAGADVPEGHVVVPGPKAEALVSYLLSLKRDDVLPRAIDPAPAKPAAEEAPAPAKPAAAEAEAEAPQG